MLRFQSVNDSCLVLIPRRLFELSNAGFTANAFTSSTFMNAKAYSYWCSTLCIFLIFYDRTNTKQSFKFTF